MKESGFLSLILHAHLPYIRHPEDDTVLEEEWLYQAITDTYIPLINTFSNLKEEGIDFKLTLSLSPTLISMLTDNLLQKRYLIYINKLIQLSTKEIDRTKDQPKFQKLAKIYHNNFTKAKDLFIKFDSNLLTAFKEFQRTNNLEIITCPATHGYLPLMERYPQAVKAQIKTGINLYQEYFTTKPSGLWLSECGYYPGHDEYLSSEEIKYFFVDTHGILYSYPRSHYMNFAPIYCPSGVAAFARDADSSEEVWSADRGYPGDYDYREFYRDIGFDLNFDYIHPYIHPDGIRKETGIKYYKITGQTDKKKVYDYNKARDKAALHAQDFINKRQKQIKYLNKHMDRRPIIVAPYDAELFGHWWYEGPIWLEELFKRLKKEEKIKPITPTQYLNYYPINQVATPALSSWGENGYNEVWLNQNNDWIYPKLNKITERMIQLADKYRQPNELEERTLNQLARELLLAQGSDWSFIIKTDTAKEYAKSRINKHINNYKKLSTQLECNSIDQSYLSKIEKNNNIFPNLNYKVYQSK